jgi:D-alanine-D-alanine ligase
MNKKINVGVIYGGRSGEHEVSLVSAESIIKALDKLKYNVIPIGITKKGTWLTSKNNLSNLKAGKFKNIESSKIILPDATKRGLVRIDNKYFATHYNIQKSKNPTIDIIIPIIHGTYGEDGTIQGLLELANIPYIGANVLASAIGMDKVIQKQLFQQAKLPVVDYIYFLGKDFNKNQSKTLKNIAKLGLPIFIKPANSGSSVGISKIHNQNKLTPAIKYALNYDRKIIIEKAVINPREIEIAVLGNDKPQASMPGEIIASNDFYDYDAKYVSGLSKTVIPAKLPKNISNKIRQMAIEAFKAIDCCGMARVDFLLAKGNKIYLSELNTIPGFTSISMYPKLWEASGLPYPKLLDKLIKLAIEYHKEKSKLSTTYKPRKNWYQ